MPGTREVIRTTCPRDCYDACGVLAVRRDGVIHQVRGDSDHPVSRGKLCRKCAIAYFHRSLSAQVKACEPLGESLPNTEIFRRLATAMGYAEPELFEPDTGVIARLLERSGLGVDFAALAATGTIVVSSEPAAVVALHPADAAERGLSEGEQAPLVPAVGRLTLPGRLSEDVPRGVAFAPKGRWPKLEARRANVRGVRPAVARPLRRARRRPGDPR